jgi:hypothetical protein
MSQEAAGAELRNRVQALQARSRGELAVLPEWSSEDTVVEGLPSRITTYREKDDEGRLRIILQLSTNEKPFLVIFQSRQVFVEGFEVLPDGGIRPL